MSSEYEFKGDFLGPSWGFLEGKGFGGPGSFFIDIGAVDGPHFLLIDFVLGREV
jgi:hypothetical protein